MVLLEDKYIKVALVEKPVRFIHTIYRGFNPSEKLRENVDFILESLVSKKITHQLINTVDQKVVSQEDREYANQRQIEIEQKLDKTLYTAMVQSKNAFTQIAVVDFVRFANDKAGKEVIQIFESEENAIAWLDSKKD